MNQRVKKCLIDKANIIKDSQHKEKNPNRRTNMKMGIAGPYRNLIRLKTLYTVLVESKQDRNLKSQELMGVHMLRLCRHTHNCINGLRGQDGVVIGCCCSNKVWWLCCAKMA